MTTSVSDSSTIPANATVLENHLRQKIVQFEDSLAKISSTRKHLKDNADLLKSEIRSTFGGQLSLLRRREQLVLEKLDSIVATKDGILSEQQDHLHQALGACLQGLDWCRTAMEDVLEHRLSSIDSVEHRINDVLKIFSSLDTKPRESAVLTFEADSLALRKAVTSFGSIDACKKSSSKSSTNECLPLDLEDYDDEDVVQSLMHKAVNRPSKQNVTVFVGRPKLSNDPKDWLMKEALTGTPERMESPTDSAVFTKYYSSVGNPDSSNGRQTQVHSWLHQIKGQVECEPHIFEDFEIVKNGETRETPTGTPTMKAQLTGDIAALFRTYFETVLMSPSNQWLLSRTTTNTLDPHQVNLRKWNDHNFALRNLQTLPDGDCFMDDLDSETRPSTKTYESSSDTASVLSMTAIPYQETYEDLWHQFVEALWNSTDSLWLLPRCSNSTVPGFVAVPQTEPTPADDGQWLMNMAAKNSGTQCQNYEGNYQTMLPLTEQMCNASITDRCGDWLMKPKNRLNDNKPSNSMSEESREIEKWLGWHAMLERVHSLGDQHWLYQPPPSKQDVPSESAW